MSAPRINRVAFLGDYVPRQCGIATFTADICEAVAAEFPACECIVGSVNDRPEGYDYPARVRFEIDEQELDSYRRAADFLNINNVEVVSVQHEFGIYGGPAGSHLLDFAARSAHAGGDDAAHGAERAERRSAHGDGATRRCSRIASSSWRSAGRSMLEDVYGDSTRKRSISSRTACIDMPFIDSNFYKDQSSAWRARRCCSPSGCSRRTRASSTSSRRCRRSSSSIRTSFISCSARRIRNLLAREGEVYRRKLERLAEERGVSGQCHFLQSLRHAGGTEGIHRRGGHLHHAVSERSADHFRHAGLHLRRGQGGDLHALLACAGVARRRSAACSCRFAIRRRSRKA